MAHMDRLAAMGQLTASLAHELHQPLGAILRNSEAAKMLLASGRPVNDELKEIVEDIRKDDQRAAEIIRRMRTLLRKREVTNEAVDLNDVVRETVDFVVPAAMIKSVRLETDLKASPAIVTGDRVHLQQVLLNLVLNGLDAMIDTPETERRLHVATSTRNGEIAVAVRDKGAGIASVRDGPHLRAVRHHEDRRHGHGTVHRQKHHRSAPRKDSRGEQSGQGCDRQIHHSDREYLRIQHMITRSSAERTRPVVHIVEDDRSARNATARFLQAAGYAVRTYGTAADFLAAAPTRSTGCVVLDLQLPGTSGLDVQRLLAETEDPLPIVFLSGRAGVQESVAAMKGGAVDFLTKTADGSQLLDAVARAIDRADVEREKRGRLSDLRARYERLTTREQEVFAHLISGQLNKQVGFDLGISEQTTKIHRHRVLEKMRADSIADLVRMAADLAIAPQGRVR